MSEEKRIYVVVAEEINCPRGRVRQPLGRQIAQACHAVGNFRFYNGQADRSADYEPITTIILRARDSEELIHVDTLLAGKSVLVYEFFDTNQDAYGEGEYLTAIATEPIDLVDTVNTIDYLPLWGQ